GTAIREALAIIRGAGGTPAGIAVALDRQEVAGDGGGQSATQAIATEAGIPVVAVATLDDLLAFADQSAGLADERARLEAYRAQYGGRCHPLIRTAGGGIDEEQDRVGGRAGRVGDGDRGAGAARPRAGDREAALLLGRGRPARLRRRPARARGGCGPDRAEHPQRPAAGAGGRSDVARGARRGRGGRAPGGSRRRGGSRAPAPRAGDGRVVRDRGGPAQGLRRPD